MSVEGMTTPIPTDAEIDQASLNEIGMIAWTVVRGLLGDTIATKEANAISKRVGKRLKAIEQELRAGGLAQGGSHASDTIGHA